MERKDGQPVITIGGRAHTLEEAWEVAAMGYPFVEVSLEDPGLVTSHTPRLLELRSEYGIDLLAHFPNEDNPFDAGVLRAGFLPRIKSLIDLCPGLGIHKATVHFWIDGRFAGVDLVSRKLEILAEIVEHAQGKGVVICIENLSERVDSFEPAFRAIPGLMMTLDIGHAQLLSRTNTSFGFIERCRERIAHVHVHDNHGGTSVKDDLHLALGDGMVDYRTIMAALVASGYDSTVTMEVALCDMPRTREALLGCIE
ncbi:MAG TPA: sugar phosphate isomerase/epimerase [Deltaproteobacteria bacterium]|nr:sugar phosphate isomerase/epimerase [Deltaproteobacteria bacterium]HOM28267.1 sugar phosphate isomerase/epimerase [Deltaproteobacteria bacterium]